MTQRYKPNATVACIVQCQDRYLMVEEHIDGMTRYNQPAGHLEQGESLTQACEREVFEETGLKLEAQALIGIYQFSADENLAFVRFTFFTSISNLLETTPQDADIQAAHWLTYDEILALTPALRSPLVLLSLDDARNKTHYPLELLNSQYLKLAPSHNAC
ncbi:NUDIX hydrolase [Shewanella sp. D64]|uniref:NUDIX hydrolase n=1 Tax=unclassified Shewanella TaxID=196818 RepID=UPI0022BA652C|nr:MULTISPECIES: NUDIX hydrolase [unclassified Shewanella]MEC4725399.1 NUDIX hydrolase [Shewanella sp. D64]MEC4735755.1 NUDIX hydrolase [Shewanella sp. E94]WBJ93272.1 NUDIX hydrolase [Shewanella sp. MTB7]